MNDYERGQIDMRERVIVGINGMLEYEQSALAEGLTTQSKSDEIQATLAFLACAIRSLPLTAPATEAGGLGAELIAWAASGPTCFDQITADCVFCGAAVSWEHEHKPNCLHVRAVAALAHAAPEPPDEPVRGQADTFRDAVERLAQQCEDAVNDNLTKRIVDRNDFGEGQASAYQAVATELRALLKPPAREGGL